MAIKTFKYFDAGIELRDQNADNASVEGQIYQNAGKIKAYIGAAIREIVTNSQTQTLTNKTFNAPDNTLTNISDTNISNTASIAKYKIAAGTINALQANSGTGVISDVNDITVTTNAITLANTKHIEVQDVTDSTTTGTAASLAAFTGGSVRLTNASLASIGNIPAGSNGQNLTLINRTGNPVIIIDSAAASGTAADRIFTGSNTDFTMVNNCSVNLRYDSTSSRWQITGMTTTAGGASSLIEVFNTTILNSTGATSLTGVAYFKAPSAFTINKVVLQIFEKGSISSGSLTLDLKKNTTPNDVGMTSIFSVLPTINFATASDYATSSGTLNGAVATLADGNWIRLDLTSIPAGLGKIFVQVYGQ